MARTPLAPKEVSEGKAKFNDHVAQGHGPKISHEREGSYWYWVATCTCGEKFVANMTEY